MPKDTPILFTGEMVRAILSGRKTQTRRIVKLTDSGRIKKPGSPKNWHPDDPDAVQACPYGLAGEGRLWVRETASLCSVSDQPWVSLTYEADKAVIQYDRGDRGPFTFFKKTPSIHMPRWACRLWLELTEVRVERLQEISQANAIAEGIERVGGPTSCNPWRNYRIGQPGEMNMHCSAPSRSYMTLWESINGDGSWARNPWVWVLSFQPTKGARDEN